MSTIYIGLDLSLTSSGVVAIQDGKILLQKLVRPKGMEGRKKAKEILIIRNMIIDVVESIGLPRHRENIKIMIEDFAYGILYMKVHGKPICGSVFEIGGLGYAVQLRLLELGYDYILTEPTTLKKFVTGKGNCKKDIMIKETLKRWKVDFDSNDICDAYGLARMREEIG